MLLVLYCPPVAVVFQAMAVIHVATIHLLAWLKRTGSRPFPLARPQLMTIMYRTAMGYFYSIVTAL